MAATTKETLEDNGKRAVAWKPPRAPRPERVHALGARVTIVGGGLAGSEAAWRLARAGVEVELREMKPVRRSPAHALDGLAELVCSNSLRSDNPANAVGLLHEELRRLGSVVLAADRVGCRLGHVAFPSWGR